MENKVRYRSIMMLVGVMTFAACNESATSNSSPTAPSMSAKMPVGTTKVIDGSTGPGSLEKLMLQGMTWEVGADGTHH